MSILDKTKAPSWGADVVVPDPGDPVRARQQPGSVVALDELHARQWSIARGSIYLQRLFVNPAQPQVNLAAPEKDANNDPEAMVIAPRDVASPRSLRYGNLDLRIVNGVKSTRVTADGIYGANWAHDPALCILAGADGTAALTQFGLAWTNVAGVGSLGNPGRAQNLKNELRPINIAKHWGLVTTRGGGDSNLDLSKTDGAGGWDAQINGGQQSVELTWPTAFANTLYCVTFGAVHVNGKTVQPFEVMQFRTATKIVVQFKDLAANNQAIDPVANVVAFSFTVFGRLAS